MTGPKKSNLKIQNIVATTSLGKPVSLTKLARTQSNTEYNPEQFPGLVLRIPKPKSAVLVFSSGNLVCTGTKSVSQVREVIDKVIKQIGKIGVKITDRPRITVQNIVASGSIDFSLNLNVLALQLENTEYEPEQFPGLVYKLVDPPATFLLFSNGKLVCTGTKDKNQLEESMKQLNRNGKAVAKKEPNIPVKNKKLKKRVAKICLKLIEETPSDKISMMEISYIITGKFIWFNYGDDLDEAIEIAGELELPEEQVSGDVLKMWGEMKEKFRRYILNRQLC